MYQRIVLACGLLILPVNAHAANDKLSPNSVANCYTGSSPKGKGNWIDQKECITSVWLVDQDTSQVYGCTALHGLSIDYDKNDKEIQRREPMIAKCHVIEKFKKSFDSLAFSTPPHAYFDVSLGWLRPNPFESVAIWTAKHDQFSVAVCFGNFAPFISNDTFGVCLDAELAE
jgi:hypothetical protein